jgi:putative membrane protein
MKNNQTRRNMSVLAAAAVFCCASAFAQTGGAQQPGGNNMQQNSNAMQNQSMAPMQSMNGGASPSDMEFVKKALQGSMAEVKTAQLALQKSSNDQVKQFAQRMISDHSKLIEQMKPVAAQIGVKVPNGPDKKETMMYDKLQALSGSDFDQAYVKAMVKDHKMDDQDFKAEITMGQSAAVKEAASKGDVVVESHLQQIEGIAKGMNVGM